MYSELLFNRPIIIFALMTLLAVVSHQLLPQRTWSLVPSKQQDAYVYADSIHGGNSQAYWVDQQALQLHCDLKPNDKFPPFCGFHLHLDPSKPIPAKDLSGFNTVKVHIDYKGGNTKLRFYLNEFEPGYSNPDDNVTTAKYLSAYMPVAETQTEFSIGMEEFTVADWWVNNNNVPRKHSLRSVKNVVAFGVDIAHPSALGTHDIKLRKVVFEGDWISKENWYLLILLSWIAVFIVVGIVRLVYFRKELLRERKKRERLQNYAAKLKNKKKKYEELSMRDQLTGLLNRHGLVTYYQHEIATVHNQWPLGLLLIDIDHFKLINDNFGHNVGDKVLQRVATAIGGLRQGDRVARWGGEEFIILLPNTALADAVTIAERFRESVADLSHKEASTKAVTISIGVTQVNVEDNFEEAIERADAALYRAKNSGRNKVVSS